MASSEGLAERTVLKESITRSDMLSTDATAPALRKRAVCAAVVVVAGLVPHEALKRLVIAIGEIHRIPPFGSGLGLAVYIEKIRFMVKRIDTSISLCCVII